MSDATIEKNKYFMNVDGSIPEHGESRMSKTSEKDLAKNKLRIRKQNPDFAFLEDAIAK